MTIPPDHEPPRFLRDPALEHFLQHSKVHLWISEPDLTPRWVSPGWLEFLGVTAGEESYFDWPRHVHPEDLERIGHAGQHAIEQLAPFKSEHRVRRRDGVWRWVLSYGQPHVDASGRCTGFAGSIVDVTEWREHADDLRRLRAYYERILDSLPAIVSVLDTKQRYVFVNRHWETHFPGPREQVIGRTVEDVLGVELGVQVRRQNDTVLATGVSARAEFRTETAAGARTFLGMRSLVPDIDGVTPLLCGIAADITELRREEILRRELEQRLAMSQRVESLGRMAGGIAHDFNNLLTSMLGNLELALTSQPRDTQGAEHLRAARAAAERAAALAQQMLAYSGSQYLERKPIDVAGVLEHVHALLAEVLPSTSPLELSCEGGLPPVLGDETQLPQVFTHLLQNAAEASADHRGWLRLSARALRVDAGRPSRCASGTVLAEGDYVAIEVSDRGSGMDAHTLEHAFEPFFSTRFIGRGLGLSHALGIVRAHGGGIELESQLGRGTTVRVLLPVAGKG